MSEIGDVRFERAVARDRSSLLAATLRGVISDDGRTMSAPAAGFETVVLHHRRRHGAAPKDKAAKADAHGKSSRRHKHGETASLSRSARRHDRLRARLETEAEADAPAAELETPYQTTVRPGERAADVAARLHVSKQALMSLNDIKATSKLRPGETLKTPYRLAYTVGQGDTLFAIAHRFGENMDALAKLNGLKHAAALHLGQTIALPLTAEDAGPRGHAEGASPKPEAAPAKLIEAELSKARAASARRAERQQAMAIAAAAHEAPPVASASQSPGSQTTQSGSEPDNGVRMAAELNERELASRAVPPAAAGYSVANEMAANRAPASPSRAQASTSAAPAPGQIATLNNPGYYPPGYNAPVLGRVRPTAPTGSSGPVTDADVSSAGRGLFVWPLRGVILTPFGDRGPGQRNDGLDISASPGESVRAAASGEVVYAGSSIPGFGNLVLVKHAGGWVTAYAHLDRIEVRMRDEVSQGEEIGQAGQTGAVDRPELHFEIRYAPDPAEKARPVDPTLVLPGAG
jgi:murein DD-endopeptidase MepM/ murein hydrolase activator NlpD